MSNFMKIFLVGAELVYEDGQTDRPDDANSRLSQFAKAPENVQITTIIIRALNINFIKYVSIIIVQ